MKSKRQRVRLGILTASFLLFPITIFYFSPYLIVLGAFQGIAAGSMLMFLLQLAAAMLLGRAFCGWVCPAGGLQELESSFAGKPFKLGKRPLLKWIIWVPWIISIATGAIVAGGIDTFDFFFQTEHGLSVASIHGLIIYLGIVALFFIPNLFVGRRGMCHCICWMAPFMIIGEKLGRLLHVPQLHIASQPSSCIDCSRCDKACPMSLPVHDLMKSGPIMHTECIQCGACCDTCPKHALTLKFGPMNISGK